MKRPQSAKPGFKGFWGHVNTEEAVYETHDKQRQVKFLKPDLTTHDFARVLPRRFHHDKERLYAQTLQLKQQLNELAEENTKLKTRISVLERQKEKAMRYDTTSNDKNKNKGRINSRDKPVMQGFKKIIRQSRDQCQILKAQNQKIKKTVKYTKINEIQIEKKILSDENKRLSAILQDIGTQLTEKQDIEGQNQELRRALEDQIKIRERAEEDCEEMQEVVEQLENKLKNDKERHQNRQNKLLRDLNVEKRKGNQFQRLVNQLRRQVNSYKDGNNISSQNRKNKSTSKTNNTRIKKIYTQHSDSKEINTSQLSVEIELKCQKEALQSELKQMKEKLDKAEQQIATLSKQKWYNSTEKKVEDIDSPQIEVNSVDEEQYEFQDYETSEDKRIQELRKEMEDATEQVELYKKEDTVNQTEKSKEPKKKKEGKETKKDKKDKADKNAHRKPSKTDKKVLTQIKELLTFRMKSQRYPFQDLQSDISSSNITSFSQADLRTMLINQPFYLTPAYTQVLLRFFFGKDKIQVSDSLTVEQLVGKLRKAIGDFELVPEEQQKEMILRVAEMTSTYPRELQVAFENIRNGPETVTRNDLTQMFRKLQLEDKYIDLIISELSLCSDDLQHLNFHGFFERFYIEEGDIANDAIQQIREQSEESHKPSTRNLKGSSKISMDKLSQQ